MIVDPLASLSLSPIVIQVGDAEYVIPALPASAWFAAVLGGGWLPIIGLLPADQQAEIDDGIAEGDLDLEEIIDASQQALEVASGWSWWSAEKFMISAGAEWQTISGQLARRGVNLFTLPLGAVLNAIYSMCVENLKPDEKTRLDIELGKPPAHLAEEERERVAEEMMQAAMEEAMRPN